MLRIVTVILNWNRSADTLACISSVRAMSRVSEIIVVDNGSTDGSVAAIRSAYPSVTIVETGANLGYAAGNNAGFDHIRAAANADAVLLLNNDTIAAPDMLAHLVAEYEAMGGNAIIGPEVRYADAPDVVWCRGGFIDWRRGFTKNIAIGTRVSGPPLSPMDVPFIVGCAMLIPVAALARIGGFDPRYFMYWEEVDWCVRAVSLGYRLRVVPAALLYHKVPHGADRPSPRVLYYLTRNRLFLLWAHLPPLQRSLAIVWTLWGQVRTGFDLLCARDWSRARALLAGIRDAARGRSGASSIVW